MPTTPDPLRARQSSNHRCEFPTATGGVVAGSRYTGNYDG